MMIVLHPTVHASLSARAEALQLSVPAFCERVLTQCASHQGFCGLMEQASTLPGYANLFAPGKAITISVRNTKRRVDVMHLQNVLTAYAVGIAARQHPSLKDVTLEARLSIFTE
jgi:hypothetical protein